MDHGSRVEKLRKLIRKTSAVSMLVSCPTNVSYLTGFTGDSSFLWLDQREMVLISDGRFSQQIAEECQGLPVIIRKPNESILNATAAFLQVQKPVSVVIEGDRFTKNEFDKLSELLKHSALVTSSGIVESLREVKDREEIVQIQRAIEIAEKAFLGLRLALAGKSLETQQLSDTRSKVGARKGGKKQQILKESPSEPGARPDRSPGPTREMSEKAVADFLENEMRANGAVSSSFRTIVGVGPRAALPHGMPSDKKLGESPFVLIDWGAREGQYVSDLTRVLFTGALPSRISRIYHTVLAAQDAAIRAIQPGALMSSIDEVARSVISSAGFGKNFTHSLGHGFGLQVHESIRMAKGQDRPLKVGMVITVEPGIYLPGVGGVRIEDDILVTKEGCRVLSSLPRDLESNRQALT